MVHQGFSRALFVHILLQKAPKFYQTKSNEEIDAFIREAIRLVATSGYCACLQIQFVTTLVEYTIGKYDCLESVCWWSAIYTHYKYDLSIALMKLKISVYVYF